ncbi:MAG: nitroreductase family protein [Deltaproteobacteria bacterium]|nr:nitroreductase family protein [Deltaproteobacteria bacterium]
MPKLNPVVEAIKGRRTTRGYQPGPVTREQLETIVDCGRLAPNALNEQAWEFTVITEAETLKALAHLLLENGPFLADASACIVVSGARSHRSVYLDGAAATENMLLAIHALGLGGCWIQAYDKSYNSSVMKLLDIPTSQTLVAILSIGVPFGYVTTPQKRSLDDVLHWEKF